MRIINPFRLSPFGSFYKIDPKQHYVEALPVGGEVIELALIGERAILNRQSPPVIGEILKGLEYFKHNPHSLLIEISKEEHSVLSQARLSIICSYFDSPGLVPYPPKADDILQSILSLRIPQ